MLTRYNFPSIPLLDRTPKMTFCLSLLPFVSRPSLLFVRLFCCVSLVASFCLLSFSLFSVTFSVLSPSLYLSFYRFARIHVCINISIVSLHRCFDHFNKEFRNLSSFEINGTSKSVMVMINGTALRVIDPVEEFW